MTSRHILDRLTSAVVRTLAFAVVLFALALAVGLYVKSRPVLYTHSLMQLLCTSAWRPRQGEFGFLPFIAGSIAVTSVAMIIAVPLSLLSAVYLAEYAPTRVRESLKPIIDLLAALPSVIFGIWGVVAIVPVVKQLGQWCGRPTTGYTVLAAGLVLAVMVLPLIISVTMDVLTAVPREAREAGLALGATRWETTRHIVLKCAAPGIVAAIILAVSRAWGETMAVLMVAGNVTRLPRSLFDPAYPLPALIANNYGEMMSIPRYDAALMFAALLLLVLVTVFNLGAQLLLFRVSRRWQ
ncbi:MAG: phosphate ABC transporter permease subunit PstC [bacterium]|nr:phosphate ABC transporter permease subunit PstC [bacterium]